MEDVVVMFFRKRNRQRKAQMRVLETIIAAAIIYVVFSAAFFLIRSSESVVSQETVDLNKLGYNLLHRIVESNTIEETIEKQPQNGTDNLKLVVQRLLPTGLFFNLTVYNCTGDLSATPFGQSWSVSNAPADEIIKSKEVAHASTIYTSKTGNVYYVIINIARAGQG